MLPRLRHVVGKLHAQKVVHIGAERLFDAQSHFRRQRSLAVQKIGERGSPTFKISAAFHTLKSRASIISVLISSPGWGGFFMGIFLMVVVQVKIAGGVRLFVVAENQPPVSRNGQAPESFQVRP
jgi:hypothetical protein